MDKTAVAELRQRLRQQRRSLSPAQQARHARAVAGLLQRMPAIRQARHVGLYLAADGELDLQPFRRWLLLQGKQPWLPVLAGNRLQFRPWNWRVPMLPNRYGIHEPLHGPQIDARRLDVLLLPLVACDRQGNRLGMGGGWYDRTLEASFRQGSGPLRLGVAHQLQQVERLPARPWDVPLHALASEHGIQTFEEQRPWPTG